MNFLRLFLTLLTITLIFNLQAQQRTCGSVTHTQELMKNPEYQQNFRERMSAFNRIAEQKTAESRLDCNNIITIPVAIHFQGINSNDRSCLENLVNQQIATLNADFQGNNSDITKWTNDAVSFFQNISNGETCVEFCVATLNHPTGYNLSNGQMAITINQTTNDRENTWAGYLNIFVTDIGNNILGYSPLGGRGNGDGVVIAKFAFGGTGACGDVSTSSSLDRGRTLTHEVGHWFLLNHIWGDGGCNVDDGVADTPNSDDPNYGCPSIGKTACNSIDLHMNYMDYTNDECMYMFSAGQSTRMEDYITANLQSLVNNAVNTCGTSAEPTCNDGILNGNETGIDCGGSCTPCSTQPTCSDGILNGNETGIDCGGSCNACPTNCNKNLIYILIQPDNYGSETTWDIKDTDGNEVASGGPYQDLNTELITEELCLPTGCYNFTMYDAFSDGICCDYGFGEYAILDLNEKTLAKGSKFGAIEIKAFSVGGGDCGDTPPPNDGCISPTPTELEYFNNITRVRLNWNPVEGANRYQIQYRKQGNTSWARVSTSRTRKTLRNLSPGTNYEVRFRSRCADGYTQYGIIYGFSTLSGKFNSNSESNLAEYEAIKLNRMYPNPTSEQLNLDYSLDINGEVEITVYDMLGRKVVSESKQQEEGVQKVQLNTSNLKSGTYILHITSENQQIIRKFIKN